MKLIRVQVVHSSDEDRVTATIVRAFMNDPAARWMYPDPAQYLENFPKFVTAFRRTRLRERDGPSSWEPSRAQHSGCRPVSIPMRTLSSKLVSRSVPERDQSVMFSVFDRMGQYHPPQPIGTLSLIGVEPQEQGKGYGSALLHHALARCDAEGALAYLESSNEQNIPLYQRHGFEVLGRIQVGTSPPITPMLRHPGRS